MHRGVRFAAGQSTGRRLLGPGALLILALALAGCEVTIGRVATPTPGGPATITPQIIFEITPVPSPTIAPPSPTPGPAGAATTYTVKAGDSLSSIAQQFGVTVDDIVRANNIENANQIFEGQELIIPPRSSAPPPTTAP